MNEKKNIEQKKYTDVCFAWDYYPEAKDGQQWKPFMMVATPIFSQKKGQKLELREAAGKKVLNFSFPINNRSKVLYDYSLLSDEDKSKDCIWVQAAIWGDNAERLMKFISRYGEKVPVSLRGTVTMEESNGYHNIMMNCRSWSGEASRPSGSAVPASQGSAPAPMQSYVPAAPTQGYMPSTPAQGYVPAAPANGYAPPVPAQGYVPAASAQGHVPAVPHQPEFYDIDDDGELPY